MVARSSVEKAAAHFAEDARLQPRLLEELDGNLAGDDTNILGVGRLEELSEDPILL